MKQNKILLYCKNGIMKYGNPTQSNQSNKLAQTSAISKFLLPTGKEDKEPKKKSLNPEYSGHFLTVS